MERDWRPQRVGIGASVGQSDAAPGKHTLIEEALDTAGPAAAFGSSGQAQQGPTGQPSETSDDSRRAPVGPNGIPRLDLSSQSGGKKPTGTGDAATQTMRALAPRFGHSFDDVVVRTDELGDARAKAHGAPAVAEGKSIFLANTVDPASAEGTRIIAHEMAHVVQQTAPPASAAPGPKASDAAVLEKEAHQIGNVVAAGGQASPTLRTEGVMPQGYGSPEHQSMGNDVHSILEPVAAGTEDPVRGESRGAELGGMSQQEVDDLSKREVGSQGGSLAPGIGSGKIADRNRDGHVPVPGLAAMLARDTFLNERSRSLTISVRNFNVQKDAAGPYLAIETDPATKQVARFEVPVSPGDMTAMNGDLYGSVENMRKAPAKEVIDLQRLLDKEAKWEMDIAAGKSNAKDEPDFDALYNDATSWRSQPVYGGGRDFGPQGQATGGDDKSYYDLALRNEAHFGQQTKGKRELEVNVHAGKLDALATGPQGNSASGNEQAWMDGHARALLLAREAFAMKDANGVPKTPEQIHAVMDSYGHEANVPATGLLDPTAGAKSLPALPMGADGKPLQRSTGAVTYESKLNDANVENAGADHYLTDSFAAGHQIVRGVIGKVLEQFVKDKGGRDEFLSFVVKRIQEGALADKSPSPKGELGTFKDKSDGVWDKTARGESIMNSHWNPLHHWIGDGLKGKLDEKLQDDAVTRSIGAKVVHDYYNRNGMIVHNAKGMTFMIKGDGHAAEAPEARQIIAMAVLESRDQIREAATTGTMGDPMKVWDYSPSIDKTEFTEVSGAKIMALMFSDGPYLWQLIKDHFSADVKPSGDNGFADSANNPTEKAISGGRRETGSTPNAQARDSEAGGAPLDMGHQPARVWFEKRQAYVQAQVVKDEDRPENGANPITIDGVTLPSPGG
ncbi:MAG: hypothetical protein JWO36_6714 [Myxococcales bacterium]|nr:hypothetical protein [Myxococcales bacterium]